MICLNLNLNLNLNLILNCLILSFEVTDLFKPPRPPAPLLEDLLVALTTAIMVVPLASICVSALMKIAVGNQHSAMWERYAVTDLQKENLHAIHEVLWGQQYKYLSRGQQSRATATLVLIKFARAYYTDHGQTILLDNFDTTLDDATALSLSLYRYWKIFL